MPRHKLSEYRSKQIVSEVLKISYTGWEMKAATTSGLELDDKLRYVVKVDQAVKGRFKKGLVTLDVTSSSVKSSISKMSKLGYESFIVEPYQKHAGDDERYLSISYSRKGYMLSYCPKGGVDIESNVNSMESFALNEKTKWADIVERTGFSVSQLKSLWKTFRDNHMVLLEINPFIISNDVVQILDCAIEVDGAGAYYSVDWSEEDVRIPRLTLTDYEKVVHELDSKSPASFNLSVLNENGSVFLLLSGGGASVVVADEVYNRGYGAQLANYGEYSGNPTMHETYLYTKEVFKLLLASTAPKKVLFIGGAVANFTDIANTFNGVIQAIDEYADELKQQKVKIFVRRGGPRQEIGLAKMDGVLDTHGLLGGVYDPSIPITEALGKALEEVAI